MKNVKVNNREILNANKQLLKSLLHEWYDYLINSEDHYMYLFKLLIDLNDQYDYNLDIYPKKRDVFNIFKMINSPKDVKVVLLGGMPSTDRNYNGIPFSENMLLSHLGVSNPGLYKFKEDNDYLPGDQISDIHFDTTLTHWLKQGVMPLHRAFTNSKFTSSKHEYVWSDFISLILTVISVYNTGVIFVFLDEESVKFDADIVKSTSIILDSREYLRSCLNTRDNIFQQINEILKSNNDETIKW